MRWTREWNEGRVGVNQYEMNRALPRTSYFFVFLFAVNFFLAYYYSKFTDILYIISNEDYAN